MARRSSDAVPRAPKDLHALVAERAYFKAQLRGFAPGGELDDWLAAERELSSEAGARAAAPGRKRAAARKSAAPRG